MKYLVINLTKHARSIGGNLENSDERKQRARYMQGEIFHVYG